MLPLGDRWSGRLTATVMSLLILLGPVHASHAARSSDSYDGNIYALYAGNGSLVPPATGLGSSLDQHRVTLLSFYLDDSAASKAFAPVLSELQRLWGRSIELIILPTDPIQGLRSDDPIEPAHHWNGLVPQVVVFDREGEVALNESGQVPIETINTALSEALGASPDRAVLMPRTTASFNELNSELVSAP